MVLNEIISQRWVTIPGVKPDTGTQDEFCPLEQATTTKTDRGERSCRLWCIFPGYPVLILANCSTGGWWCTGKEVNGTDAGSTRQERHCWVFSNNFRQINMSYRREVRRNWKLWRTIRGKRRETGNAGNSMWSKMSALARWRLNQGWPRKKRVISASNRCKLISSGWLSERERGLDLWAVSLFWRSYL